MDVSDSERSLQILADAGEILGALEVGAALQRLCDLVAPAVSDWCEISVIEGAELRSRALKHCDPGQVTLAEDVLRQPRYRHVAQRLIGAALKGKSLLVDRLTAEVFASFAVDPEYFEQAQRFGIRSLILAPMVARGRAMGMLTLATSDSERTLGMGELNLARALATRAAFAVDNARLLEAERQARLQAEQSYREQLLTENRLRAIADNSNAFIWIGDLDSRLVFVNRLYEQVFKGQLIGKTLFDVFSPEIAEKFHAENRQVAEAGVPMQFDEEVPQADGLHSYVTVLFPIRDSSGQVALVGGISTDITQRKRLEQSLRQSSKMEAVGHLAGGIAHEFNNILTAISAANEIMSGDLPSSGPLRDGADRIQRCAGRASKLIHQLLVFGQRQVRQPRVLNVNAIINGMDQFLRPLIGEDITVSLALTPAIPDVTGDQSELEEMLLNLVLNAREAMPTGGELRISTGIEDGSVVLDVADTGCGMTPEVVGRIFEPFYTTKQVGKGTGLGMSTVLGIVTQCGGRVDVKSAPGSGTRVHVVFPAAARAQESERLTVLVAEDSAEIRDVVTLVLSRAGYHVLGAADGAQALATLSSLDGMVDLLITDIVMPGLDGCQLAKRVEAAFPHVRILFMSAYPGDVLERYGRLESTPFLAKPFSMDGLLERVRSLTASGRVDGTVANNATTPR